MRPRTALKRAGTLSQGRLKQRASPRRAEHHCALVCFGNSGEPVIASMASAKVGSIVSAFSLIGMSSVCPTVDRDGPKYTQMYFRNTPKQYRPDILAHSFLILVLLGSS